MPDTLQKTYDRNKSIGKEMLALHTKLKVSADLSDDERKVIAKELVSLEDEKNANWQKIDIWSNTPPSQREQVNIAEMAKKIAAAKKYIDRNFDSKNAETLTKVKERLEYLKECGIDYSKK
jgi:hypothetical protein